MACPDLSIRNDEFQGLLTNFEQRVTQLREQYFELAAIEELDRVQKDPTYKGAPFPTLPGGMFVRGSDGKPELIPHEQIQTFLAALPAAEKLKATINKRKAAKKPGQRSKARKSRGRQ